MARTRTWRAVACALGMATALAGAAAAEPLRVANRALSVELDPVAASLTVLDNRSGARWRMATLEGLAPRFGQAVRRGTGIDFRLECGWSAGAVVAYACRLELLGSAPDLRLTAAADPNLPMPGNVRFLAALAPERGKPALAVADYSNGHLYPMDAPSIPCGWLDGDRLDLPFLGLCDLASGAACAMILETPEDAIVETRSRAVGARSLQVPSLQFRPVMGRFGYPRSLLYRFAPSGGYVAAAKAYRDYARARGLLVTLATKARRNPNVARLFGAPDVWGDASLAFAREARALGVRKMLIHGRSDPAEMRRINAQGYLTSEYDNYTDVLPIEPGGKVDSSHDRIPESVTRNADGSLMKAWLTFDGKTQYMKRCPSLWRPAALQVVPRVLARWPYLGRFVDVTTAEALYECYDAAHRLDRRGKQRAGADLLGAMRGLGLVVGGEHGIWWGVPHQDYIEGMMSSYQFSWPAGHLIHPKTKDDRFTDPWGGKTPPWAEYADRGLGHATRIPLWELVFHDCVVSTWYWGDSTDWLLEAAPETLPRKDLFNIVYGTMPMLWADAAGSWQRDRAAFLRTCRTACKVHEAVAGSEMVSHTWLTPDRAVQRSRFANGVVATGNFGSAPATVEQGGRRWTLPEHGYIVTGPGIEASLALERGVATLRVRRPDFRCRFVGKDGWVSFRDGPGVARLLLEGRPLTGGFAAPEALGGPGSSGALYSTDASGARRRLVARLGPGRPALGLPWPGAYQLLTGQATRACDLQVSFAPGAQARAEAGAAIPERLLLRNRGAGAAGRVTLRWYADAALPSRLLYSRIVEMGARTELAVAARVPTDRLAGTPALLVTATPAGTDLAPADNQASRPLAVARRADARRRRLVLEANSGRIDRADALVMLPMPAFVGDGATLEVAEAVPGAPARPVPAQLDLPGSDADSRAACPVPTLCFVAPGRWPAGVSRRFVVTWSEPTAGRPAVLGPWSAWVSPDAARVATPVYAFDLGSGSVAALRIAGVAGGPVKSAVVFSSAATGWVAESGRTTVRRLLAAGPARALVVVRRSMDGGHWYRKLYSITATGYDVAVTTDHWGSVPDRTYYAQDARFTDSAGRTAVVDGSGDAEGVSNATRSPAWYHLSGADWAEAAVPLAPVGGITYWDASARGGIGFEPAGGPEHRVRYRFAAGPRGAEWAAQVAAEASQPPAVTILEPARRLPAAGPGRGGSPR